jgi:superfamily II DNA or RNA helicase
MQLNLLAKAPEAVVQAGDPDGLRPYQREAVTAVHRALEKHRSTLVVMATGLGKTQTFGAIAKHWPSRVLVLAHRDELLAQARRRIEQMTGCLVDLEQAESRAGDTHIVVGSVQTMHRLSRLHRWKPDDFGLVIVDEAHHILGKSYGRVLDYFPGAKVLGVTATPDRGDKQGLRKVLESVAFEMGIGAGIAGGWLCPVSCAPVYVDSIDLTSVHTVAGDLNQGELDAIVGTEANLHAVAKAVLELAGDRKTIIFSGPTVATSVRLTEMLNRPAYRPGCAREVNGSTDEVLRKATLKAHERGDFQFLVNVGVATEGYDSPSVSCIAIARMTGSRALYAQMVGRGLRTAPGKRDCLVVDFVGVAGRHDLANPVDLLGDGEDDEVKATAKAALKDKPGQDVGDALKKAKAQKAEADKRKREARENEMARRAQIALRVQWRSGDPYDLLGRKDLEPTTLTKDAPLASRTDVWELEGAGFKAPPQGWTAELAEPIVAEIRRRRAKGLASARQIRGLAKVGIDAKEWSTARASRYMDVLFQNNERNGRYFWAFLPGQLERLNGSNQ